MLPCAAIDVRRFQVFAFSSLVGCTPLTPPPPREEARDPALAPGPAAETSCASSVALPASELRTPFDALAQRVNELVPEGCIDKVGCPEPQPLPTCDPALVGCKELATPETFHERARKLEGKKLAVRGQLVRLRSLTTKLECPEGSCCNRSRAVLAIGSAGDAVNLLDGDALGVFSCMGDESANCCVLPANVEVAVIGVVSPYKLGHGLSQVSLCGIHKNEEAGP
jgi:hypothetical protein